MAEGDIQPPQDDGQGRQGGDDDGTGSISKWSLLEGPWCQPRWAMGCGAKARFVEKGRFWCRPQTMGLLEAYHGRLPSAFEA